jgi:hypothetical protein
MLVLTDHRINTNAVTAPAEGCVHPLLALPGNPLAFHITDDAYERGEAGLFRMTIDDFIVLLMDAVSFFNTGRATAQARRIVNELEAQLAGGSCTSLRLGNWPSRYDSLCDSVGQAKSCLCGCSVRRGICEHTATGAAVPRNLTHCGARWEPRL